MGVRKKNSTWILILTSLGFFMSMMDSMIVTTASTAIRTDFNISVNTLQWALNAYNITIAAVLLVGVSLGERIGRRKVYSLGIFIFTLGSIFCALANTIDFLIIARIVEGIGASVMTPMSMAILTHALPESQRGKALGIWSGIGGLALIVGPSLGGFIVAKLAWQWIFWINVPIGIAAIYLSNRFLPESTGNRDQINLTDSLLIVVSSAGIIWSLSAITSFSSTVIPIIIGFISLGLGVWFVIRQNKSSQPMIPLYFFQSNIFTGGNLATFLLYGAMYGVVFFLPQFLQVVGHNNSFTVGLEILPWTGTLVLVAPFAGKSVDRFGEKLIATVGLICQGSGYLMLTLFVNQHSSYLIMIFPLALAGVGLSMAGPALQKAVLGSVDSQEIGKASGVYNVFRLLGGAVGTTISVIVFNHYGSIANLNLFTHGFQATMLSAAILSILGIVFSLRFRTTNN